MIRKLMILFISIMPFNLFRIFLYRVLLKYDISYKAKVGMFNYLDCKKCTIKKNANLNKLNFIRLEELILKEKSVIKFLNIVKDINKLELNTGSSILVNNRVFGTRIGLSPYKKHENLLIGERSLITKKHLFDLSDEIIVGDNVLFAGVETHLWTHGFVNNIKIQKNIIIKNNVYIGSRSTILSGIVIEENVNIGASTTVSKSILEKNVFVVSSNQFIKEKGKLNEEKIIEYKGSKFVRK